MKKNVNMPRLSPEMESGVLCAWLKEEGDAVEVGDALFEIETDKVVNQIESTDSPIAFYNVQIIFVYMLNNISCFFI